MRGQKKGLCFDITALGELLIDMLPYGVSPRGNALLEVNPGGAPCNALSMAASLGKRCAFIGKVGRDKYGELLAQTIAGLGVNIDGLVFDPCCTTTLALVHLDPATGERDFTFVRKPGADIMLRWDEVDRALIDRAQIFHFGSVSMSDSPARQATMEAVRYARDTGKAISFDPNIRWPLWRDAAEALSMVRFGLQNSDMVKISLDELEALYGQGRPYKMLADMLLADFPNIKALFVTMGHKGCYYRLGGYANYFPAFVQEAVDTTGAGDSFTGVCLACVADTGIEGLTPGKLDGIVRYATAAAALVVSRYGSLSAMPTREEVEAMLAKNGYQTAAV